MTRVWWRDGLALGKAARGRLAHRYPPGSKDFIAGAGFEWADLHTIDLHGAILADEPPVKPPKDRGLEFSLIARPADGGVPTIADAGWFRVPNAPAVVGAGLSTGEHFKYDLKAKFALFPTDDGVVFASPASKGDLGFTIETLERRGADATVRDQAGGVQPGSVLPAGGEVPGLIDCVAARQVNDPIAIAGTTYPKTFKIQLGSKSFMSLAEEDPFEPVDLYLRLGGRNVAVPSLASLNPALGVLTFNAGLSSSGIYQLLPSTIRLALQHQLLVDDPAAESPWLTRLVTDYLIQAGIPYDITEVQRLVAGDLGCGVAPSSPFVLATNPGAFIDLGVFGTIFDQNAAFLMAGAGLSDDGTVARFGIYDQTGVPIGAFNLHTSPVDEAAWAATVAGLGGEGCTVAEQAGPWGAGAGYLVTCQQAVGVDFWDAAHRLEAFNFVPTFDPSADVDRVIDWAISTYDAYQGYSAAHGQP